MNSKLLMPTIIAAALASLASGLSAEARPNSSFFSGGVSAQNQANWSGQNSSCNSNGNRRHSRSYNNMGGNNYGNGWNNSFANNGSYNNGGNAIFAQGQQLRLEQQRLQQRLASGNLNPNQAARLQSRLAALQSQQGVFNGQLNNRLSGEQSRLQALLASGNLNPYQTTQIQNRLANLLSAQNNISSGGFFQSNGGVLSSLRNSLGF